VTALVLGALAGLAVLTWLVRRGESAQSRYRSPDEEPDRIALEDAEREVRDLHIHQDPDDGFEGDDWGPGATK
jgi:hypothetical protein